MAPAVGVLYQHDPPAGTCRTSPLGETTEKGLYVSYALGLERLFRDVQAARYHPLRGAAQRRYTGRLALGLDLDD